MLLHDHAVEGHDGCDSRNGTRSKTVLTDVRPSAESSAHLADVYGARASKEIISKIPTPSSPT